MISSLANDTFANPKFMDPLYFTVMTDPVVISTGVVMDRSTVLDETGELRFK
jgi:hypothetical protein